MHFTSIVSSVVSVLALSGTTVFAFANGPSSAGQNMNLYGRGLNDLANDLYARGWADREMYERDLQSNMHERSLEPSEWQLQERAPVEYTYVGGGHTVHFEISTPIILAGVAFVAGKKALSYIRSHGGSAAVASFVSSIARALHVSPQQVGEGVITATTNAASVVRRNAALDFEDSFQSGFAKRSFGIDTNDLAARGLDYEYDFSE